MLDISGDIGPFQLAIILTIVALFLIFPWKENYGHEDQDEGDEGSSKKKKTDQTVTTPEQQSFLHSIYHSLVIIKHHPNILLLGLSQAFFEGAVYTFGKGISSRTSLFLYY